MIFAQPMAAPYRRSIMDNKEIIQRLRELGLTEYGSVIPGDKLRQMAGIEYPTTGTKAEFDALALDELSAVDYVRNCLLNEGKYLKAHRDDYRILSPAENNGQVEAYMRSADNKLRRAIKLSKNTPAMVDSQPNNHNARLMMKRESIKRKMSQSLATK